LDRLRAFFTESLSGKPQVVLVAGDAGIGKTALVQEFCRQAQRSNDKVVVACGQCASEHGDPYLPFVEIAGLLTGDTKGELGRRVLDNTNAQRLKGVAIATAEIIVEVGGDLVGLLVPGAALLDRVVALVAKALKVGWVSRLKKQVEKPGSREGFKPEQFFEQFSRVVLRLSAKAPLVLAVDDLHWADQGSLELFFYLSRRLQQTASLPVVLLGTYRPAEIHLVRDGDRHPLERIVHELRRYWPDLQIDLEQTLGGEAGRAFVDALADAEPNRLDAAFRSFLFHRTDGHPLFTIGILRMLKQRGTLIKDKEGRWVLDRPITLDELPDSVEAVIEERIEQLDKQLRDILICGSVEGERFTAEIVARVRRLEELRLAEQLNDELEKRHRLVVSDAELEAAQKHLHAYRFIHAVFQRYLYGTLGDMQRQQLHRAVGESLEALHSDDVGAVAVQLARHFDLAFEDEKAIKYLLMAGDQAAAAYANADALRHYARAREITARGAGDRRQQEYRVVGALAGIQARQGRPAEEWAEITRMLELAQALGDQSKIAESHIRESRHLTQAGDYTRAKQAARDAFRVSEQTGDENGAAAARLSMGEACAYLAEHDEALEYLRAAEETCRRSGDRHKLADAARLTALVYLNRNDYPEALVKGDVHLLLGNYEESLELHRQSLAIDEEVGYKYGQAWCHHDIGVIRINQGDLTEARRELEQALALADELQAPNLIVLSKNDLSRVFRLSGGEDSPVTALRMARESTETADRASLAFGQIAGRSYQAMAHLMLGQKNKALEESQAAIALLDGRGETEALPEEMYCNHSSILLALGEPEEARSWLKKAYDVIVAKGTRITNQAFRDSFFTKVPLNREIMIAWHSGTSISQSPTEPGLSECNQ
jgi:adenylate cyclase